MFSGRERQKWLAVFTLWLMLLAILIVNVGTFAGAYFG